MTILYVLISTDPFGGATKSFMALLRGVMQAGIKPVVVVPDTNGIYDTLAGMGVRIIVQYEKGCTWTGAKNLRQTLLFIPRQVGRMIVNFSACRSLDKKLRGIDFDLVHSNNSVASLGRYIARKRHIPHLY
ncbi:MAG: glycosyltransferase, partial [Prevotella sp.]|nr:glycosyltransferase [Prevotella sp.]